MGTQMGLNYAQQESIKIENINYNNDDNIAKNFTLSKTYLNDGKTLTEVIQESINSDYDITNMEKMSSSPSKINYNNENKINEKIKKQEQIIENGAIKNKTTIQEGNIHKDKNNLILNNNNQLIESKINNKNININININFDIPKDKKNEAIIKTSKDKSEISVKNIDKNYPEEKILIKLDSDGSQNNNIIIEHSSDNLAKIGSNKKVKKKKNQIILKSNNSNNNENEKDDNGVKIILVEGQNQNKIKNKYNTRNDLVNENKPIKMITSSLWKDIRKDYKFDVKLGGGHFGTVRKAHRRNGKRPYQFYAIKSIPNKNLTKEDFEDLVKEVDIISGLDHPNIIKFYETYHDDCFFHIVMELCKGKEVFEKLANQGNISEKKVVNIIYKVLLAISHCHRRGISHRDLKPENIVFESLKPDAEIKIIDFGLSRKYNKDEKLHTILGTPYYVAPEVLKGEYDEKCDIWSIGAMTYFILCGVPPFEGQSNNEIFRKIVRDDITFNPKRWKNISNNAKDFVRICLNKNPNLRPSASKAIEHKWFSNVIKEMHSIKHLNKNALINLKNFDIRGIFKQTIMKYLLNTINEEQINIYRNTFLAMDYFHNGVIEKSEIKKAFTVSNLIITDDEISYLFNIIDGTSVKGGIGYTEFLMACIDQKLLFTRDKLDKAFNYFDVDSSEYIEFQDLKEAFLRMGRECINSEDIEAIITDAIRNIKTEEEIILDKDSENKMLNKISKEDFLKIFEIL